MLQRIYGTAWRTEKELKAYLHMLEEAEKRDHRRLGREMNLFHFQEEAPGAVFWHPNGWILFSKLIDYMRTRQERADTWRFPRRRLWIARFGSGLAIGKSLVRTCSLRKPKMTACSR